MKGRFRFLCGTLLAASTLLSPAVSAVVRADDLKVGDTAPDFSLPGSDGKTYKLSEMHGHYVVLAWFPMAFTGG